MALTSDIRSGISNFIQDGVRSLFGRDKPVEVQQYLNKHTHKDAQVITERISLDGRYYWYQFTGPTDAEVQKEIDSTGPHGSSVPRGTLASQARQKLLKEKSDKIHRSIAEAFAKYQSYLYSLDEARAETGISRRLKEYTDFVEFAGDVGDIVIHDEDVHGMSGGATFGAPVREPKPDDVVKKELSKLVDELNIEILKRDEKREDRQNLESGGGRSKGGRVIDGSIYKTSPTSRFVDGKSHVKYEVEVPKVKDSDTVGDAFHRLAVDFGGYGDKDYQFLEQLKYFNRFGKTTAAAPREMPGFTFITRPHLNLSNQNLVHLRNFYPLLYASSNSVQMYIRQMLDPVYCESNGGEGGPNECPFIDKANAFNTLLFNSLKSINGFPDPDLTTESTAGGFFSEQQTNVIGYNRLAKGQDLQLEFRDYIGGPVLAMHDYWCQYMGNIADGSMCQYMDDIENNLMGYTVSIYRFITDHTGRIITRWAKATGCFPKMQPTGTPFNVNQNEKTIESVKTFTIPYWCHHFGYNDPAIISEFNTLVGRYNPLLDVNKNKWLSIDNSRSKLMTFSASELGPFIRNGHHGTPYILQPEPGVFELAWIEDRMLTNLYDVDQSTNKRVTSGATNVVKEYPMYPSGEDSK